MKRVSLIAAITMAVLLAFGSVMFAARQAENPRAMLRKLEKGSGNRNDLIMKLNMARQDIVEPMVEAFQSENSKPEFRADILDLLVKRSRNRPDDRIEKLLAKALSDPDTLVRRKAFEGLAIFGAKNLAKNVIEAIRDPDMEVRREVYLFLQYNYRMWGEFDSTQISDVYAAAQEQYRTGQDPHLRYLARHILGSRIEGMCSLARQEFQQGNLRKAVELFEQALELDSLNHHARIGLARHYLHRGEKKKAFQLAREYGLLIEAPILRQAPTIDGDPEPEIAQGLFERNEFTASWDRYAGPRIQGKGRLLVGHHKGMIYLAFVAYESDLDSLVTQRITGNTDMFMDDAIEIYLDPKNTEKDKYHFVFNSKGQYIEYTNRNPPHQAAAKTHKDRGYWAVEFMAKARDLEGARIDRNAVWGVNCMWHRPGLGQGERGSAWPFGGHHMNVHLYPMTIFTF